MESAIARTTTTDPLRRLHAVSCGVLIALVLALAFAFCTLSASPTPALADDAHDTAKRTVRVASYDNGDYQRRTNDGIYSGYVVDYLTEIGRYANWTYEYVDYNNWEDAYAAVEAGEVDLMPLVFQTDERAEKLLFSNTPLCETYTTLNVRADDTRFAFEDFQAFEGMKVGVIEDTQDARNFFAYAKEHGFTPDVVDYHTTEDLLNALDAGAIDGAAITHLGSGSRFRMVAQFGPAAGYVAFPRDRAEVRDAFNKAVEQLQLRDPEFASTMYARYMGINTEQDPVFTTDEYAYLASAPVLRVTYDAQRAPLSYTNPETGEFAGVAAQLLADIARITGLQFEFVPAELQTDEISLLESGEVDIACGITRDADIQSGGSVVTTGPYLRDPLAIISNRNPDGVRVAVPERFIQSDIANDLDASDEVVRYDSPKACLDALIENQADRTYLDTHVASFLMTEPQYAHLTMTTLTSYSNELSLGVSATADPRLASILDRCVQYTSDSKMATWLSESSLEVHPTSPIDFLRQYPVEIIGSLFAIFVLISLVGFYVSRMKVRTAQRIKELSFTDPLTGGWSLARFRTEVSEQLNAGGRDTYALLYLDIKRFKSFNAAFGYTRGDELLVALSHLIGKLALEGEHYARITADEFVVLSRWDGWDAFVVRFDELDRQFNQLPLLEELSHRLSLQAGVCLVEPTRSSKRIDAQTLAEYIDCARYARDSIGETSRSTAALYNDDMKDRDIAERALVAQAHDALERGEFTAYYQPKVDLATGRVVGFEALARWISPERGLVPPDEFIPLFEKTGLVKELDLQIFRQSCERIRDHLHTGGRPLLIACNFSRLHLLDDAFPERLKAIVDAYDVPVEQLELELTENIVMEDLERAERVCHQLKDLGFRISIDDFGSGYSSLGTLLNLPIDVLKLDRSFLTGSETAERCKTILDGVVGIADRLGVRVVVEGVETREQAAMLMHIDRRIVAQGFLYSRPVPREESDRQFAVGTIEPNEQS